MKNLTFYLLTVLFFLSFDTANAQSWDEMERMQKIKENKVSSGMPDKVIITIEDDNIFSQCFRDLDTNNDGKVTLEETQAATTLILDRGGRSNIITDYAFLIYFPNLTTFSVGNTPVESLDLRYQKKLERVNLTNALWLKELVLAEDCNPEIIYPQSGEKVKIYQYRKINIEDIPKLEVPDLNP